MAITAFSLKSAGYAETIPHSVTNQFADRVWTKNINTDDGHFTIQVEAFKLGREQLIEATGKFITAAGEVFIARQFYPISVKAMEAFFVKLYHAMGCNSALNDLVKCPQ